MSQCINYNVMNTILKLIYRLLFKVLELQGSFCSQRE